MNAPFISTRRAISRRSFLKGTGVAIPPEQNAAGVFRQLFLQGTPEQIEAQLRELDTGRKILDAVADQAEDSQRKVGASDRNRLDQYFTNSATRP